MLKLFLPLLKSVLNLIVLTSQSWENWVNRHRNRASGEIVTQEISCQLSRRQETHYSRQDNTIYCRTTLFTAGQLYLRSFSEKQNIHSLWQAWYSTHAKAIWKNLRRNTNSIAGIVFKLLRPISGGHILIIQTRNDNCKVKFLWFSAGQKKRSC